MNITNRKQCNAHRRLAAHLLVAISPALVLVGCGSTGTVGPVTVPISVDNNKYEFLPELRLRLNLDGHEKSSEAYGSHAIEFGIAHVSGQGNQSISGGEQVAINSSAIAGPAVLTNKFGLYYTDLAYRWRKFPWGKSLGFELGGGGSYAAMNLASSAAGQYISGSFDSTGANAGMGLIWRINGDSSIQARTNYYVSSGRTGLTSLRHYEISYARIVGERLSVRAGYADWTIYGDGNTSDFKLHAAGPTLLLQWDFSGTELGNNKQSDVKSRHGDVAAFFSQN